jgi:hypothetical protein
MPRKFRPGRAAPVFEALHPHIGIGHRVAAHKAAPPALAWDGLGYNTHRSTSDEAWQLTVAFVEC